ncbi:MAG: biopolymer transporter ExbD [Pseudomonadota bacterium]
MSRRHHYRKNDEQVELDITTFLNLMVVLIPFLLVSAVFSTLTIQELNVPAQASAEQKPDKPPVTIEIIVRKGKIQISDGKRITVTIPKKDDKYDIVTLSEKLLSLKGKLGEEKQDAIILLEPDIEYEDVIRVMDAVKVTEVQKEDEEKPQRVILFPQLSLGDAP